MHRKTNKDHALLLCIDLEAGSTALVRFACSFARRCNQAVRVLHVLPAGMPKDAAVNHGEQLHFLLARMGLETAQIPIEILEGIPENAILSAAREHDVDAIILGRRRRSPIERIYVGSTTSAVISQAPCPVLVVPLSVEPAE